MSGVTKALRIAAVLLAVLGVMVLAAAPQAQAADRIRDILSPSTVAVVPFYDITASHASFLILHSPAETGSGGSTIEIFFYDQTCAKKADQIVSLTPFDTAFLNVAKLNPAAPTQGAILLFKSDSANHRGFFADFVNVDFTAGTSTLLNAITTVHTGTNFPRQDWAVYTRENFAVVTFGPKEAAPFSTTVTLSCPRGTSAGTLGGDMLPFTTGSVDFSPATGTTTSVLDIFVFDTDEKFLGSIHNVTCRCFERAALKTWVPQALTSDVVVYFGATDSGDTDRSVAGFQETDFVSGATKLHAYTYLHHNDGKEHTDFPGD